MIDVTWRWAQNSFLVPFFVTSTDGLAESQNVSIIWQHSNSKVKKWKQIFITVANVILDCKSMYALMVLDWPFEDLSAYCSLGTFEYDWYVDFVLKVIVCNLNLQFPVDSVCKILLAFYYTHNFYDSDVISSNTLVLYTSHARHGWLLKTELEASTPTYSGPFWPRQHGLETLCS